MAEVIFNFEGINTTIQCNIEEKMIDIIDKFKIKAEINDNNNNFFYLYNGSSIRQELKFIEQANKLDKTRKKMNILVTKNDIDKQEDIKEIISKDIICPECYENILINIKEFKINLYGCKNEHIQENILLNIFEELNKINITHLKCNICNNKYKQIVDIDNFFICNKCDKNMCLICKSNHDKSHKIINYIDKKYVCKKHDESYTKYCKNCMEDICILCENDHKAHDIFDLSKILISKNELEILMKGLSEAIHKFKFKINIMEKILNRMVIILETFYKVNNDIINNYDTSKRNFHKLENINFIKNYNKKLIKELNKVIEEDKIYEYSLNNFYNEDGDKYFGETKNGLKEGNGILYYNKENQYKRKRYEGEFKNDKLEGKGIMYWDNGAKYEGVFKNDNRDGKGIYYYINGEIYEGEFKNGIKEGKGIYYYINGDKYEGDFKRGMKEGKGKFYYKNGDKYDGDWKNDLKEGKGVFTCINGEQYQGDFKNDKKDGKGYLLYNNGEQYKGDFSNNKREGQGEYLWNNGDKYKGIWNDKFKQ